MFSEYGYVITSKSPSIAWNANEYRILDKESGGGTFAKDNSQATISYLCEYAHFEQFIDVVLGKTVKSGSSLKRSAASPTFGPTNGSMPQEHDYLYNFFAASATVDTEGTSIQAFGGPVWSKAIVNVVFRPPSYPVMSDYYFSISAGNESVRFTTKVSEYSAEFQSTLGQFVWQGKTTPEGNPWPLDIQPGFIVPSTRWIYTWHQIPASTVSYAGKTFPILGRPPMYSTVVPLLGSINNANFDGFNIGTCLFSGWAPRLILPSAATDGNYYWDVAYQFTIRDYGSSSYGGEYKGWNFAYDPILARWDRYNTTTGQTMYPYSDLNTLFNVSW